MQFNKINYLRIGISLFLFLILFNSCKDTIVSTELKNIPPETQIWVDTISQSLSSQIKLNWWGDDPDGFVKGFKVSLNSNNWIFTTSTESTFTITINENGIDTSLIQIASVDNLDLIDPTPAKINTIVKNSPPTISFDQFSEIPSQTFPVASFSFKTKDIDGKNSIKNIFICLNDTSDGNWIAIPNYVSFVTLIGDLSDTTKNIIDAEIKIGTNLTTSNIKIKNLKLNSNNKFFIYCTDISGAKSKIAKMPEDGKNWYVRKPNNLRHILMIDDYSSSFPNPDEIYRNTFSLIKGNDNKYFTDLDILDINTSQISPIISQQLFIETLKLYKSIFWYGKISNLDLAQKTIPQYLNSGGKVLFSTGFPNLPLSGIDPKMLALDFTPIDSLITSYKKDSTTNSGYISRFYKDSKIIPTDSISNYKYPILSFDRTAIFGTYAFEPSPTDSVIYRFDFPNINNSQENWVGTPSVGIKSNNGNMIFFTVPLHLMQNIDSHSNKTQLNLLLERIFKGDFKL